MKPSIFTLQETKRKLTDPPIKAENLVNYQIFELNREVDKKDGGKGVAGGGLAIGALHDLNPILVRQGDDSVECLTIEVKAANISFMCVTGYGPQIHDTSDRKERFWKYLDEEAKSAVQREVGIIFQIDSNAWAGENLIPGDNNKQNNNGVLLEKFLEDNPGLVIVNSLSCCIGKITRHRETTMGTEEAILDLYIVCQRILPLIKHMEVDHDGKYLLTNFRPIMKGKKVTCTDHKAVILTLDLTFSKLKLPRSNYFNFQNKDDQMKFFNMTTNTNLLSNSFSTHQTLEAQAKVWNRNLHKIIQQSFTKIRHRKQKFRENDIGNLLQKRKKLKMDKPADYVTNEMHQLELQIASKIEEKHYKKVKQTIGDLTGDDGNTDNNKVWTTINRLFPKHKEQKPLALKDKHGNLITNYNSLKSFAVQAITERLRKRPAHPEWRKLVHLKTKLAKLRLKLCTKNKTPAWNMNQLSKAISLMKSKKCRDSYGFVSELMKHGIAGHDFKLSLLSLLNKIKKQLKIPHFMNNVNIALLPKPGKKDLQDIKNHRGIFLINKFRSLLMRLLLNDKYDVIDNYMSDSNIGGRKGRGIRDHLFIVNGIINEHCNSNNGVSIQILDYLSCFDSMWQHEVVNDLYKAGLKDDKLSLLYKINEVNNLAIKTSAGLSDRFTVKNIICQGDPWGSIQCSLMVDGIGKRSLDPLLEPYKYRGIVPIPILGMVDDELSISEPGYKTARLNAFLNATTSTKKLQYGPEKCFVMHVGKSIPEYKKPELYVDGWRLQEVTNTMTGQISVKEIFEGEQGMSQKQHEKYLGQIISSDGSNLLNIKYRSGKGKCMSNKILNILEHIPGGKYHFKIAIILRDAYFISTMLSGSETWYNIKEMELRILERTDEAFLRNILGCSNQVTSEIMHLELGTLPVRYIALTRKLFYLHHILQQKKSNSLLYQFFATQRINPKSTDWVSQVIKDLKHIKLNLEFDEIEVMPQAKFKHIVREKVKNTAFEYLINKKCSRDKVKHIIHEHFKMAGYLNENEMELTVKERQFLFQCRVKDIDVRGNRSWKYENVMCISCNKQEETQEHILTCETLIAKNYEMTYLPDYSELYSKYVEDQIYISRIIYENMRIRDNIASLPM